jgi:uncharacterized membrane protein YraQ (UPF0718 family)
MGVMLYNLDTSFIISLFLIDLIKFGATILLLEPEIINIILGVIIILVIIPFWFNELDKSNEEELKKQIKSNKPNDT